MKTLYGSLLKYENSKSAALYFENKTVSFKELIKNIKKTVSYLRDHGIGAHDVVTVALPNIPVSVYLFYALDAIGAVQNIIHPLSTPTQIIEAMQRTNSKTAFLLETQYGESGEIFAESGFAFHFANPMRDVSALAASAFYLKYKKAKRTPLIHSADELYKYPEADVTEERDSNEDSVYLHSGGTTGIPKVIALSDSAICNLSDKVEGIIGGSIEGKSMLAVLPSFHGFGLGMGIHSPLSNGAASALMMKFDAQKVIRWINEGKVNLVIGVPLLYQKLMAHPDFERAKLKNLEFCFVGGDSVTPSLINKFNGIMAAHGSDCMMLEGYGLTETVTVCTVNTKKNFRVGSVGKPLEEITAAVLDDEQKPLAPGEVGEVYISSNTVMNGYLADDGATAATIVDIGGARWVRTGDLGYIDEDGYVFLKGRKKRLFKISGINVYPAEIEKACTEHEGVHDAAMEFFSEPKPHTVLYLIKNKKCDMSEQRIKEELLSVLAEKFLKYSLPEKIVFMDAFPQTKVGKIDHKAFVDPA